MNIPSTKDTSSQLPELAFYYPNTIWDRSDWIKSLILFFDGIALLIPRHMQTRALEKDRAIVAGLQEHGLLKIIEPETFIDQATAGTLANKLTDIIQSGSLDALATRPRKFTELAYSKLGSEVSSGIAQKIYAELRNRNLAKDTFGDPSLSIVVHQEVQWLVLVLLTQLLRQVGKSRGLELWTVTDQHEIQSELRELLNLISMPSHSHVVSLDLATVSVNLSSVPLDEVLCFRNDHREAYHKYMRNVRKFVRDINSLPLESQQEALQDRKSEIEDEALSLSRSVPRVWKRRAALAFSLLGAVWTWTSGDALGAVAAMGAGFSGAELSSAAEAGVYSYLLQAQQRFIVEVYPVV